MTIPNLKQQRDFVNKEQHELCPGAWAVPPSPIMLKHDNNYHTCSACGEKVDSPGSNNKGVVQTEPPLNLSNSIPLEQELDELLYKHLHEIKAGHDNKLKSGIVSLFHSHMKVVVDEVIKNSGARVIVKIESMDLVVEIINSLKKDQLKIAAKYLSSREGDES